MEIEISRDLRSFKTKDIGNFSLKEAGFIAVGFAAFFATYKLTGSKEFAFVPMGVVLAFGFLKPCGLSLWQFLRTVMMELISPMVYVYDNDFVYDYDDIYKKYKSDEDTPPEKRYILPDVSVIQEELSEGQPPVKRSKEEKALIIS